MLKDSQNFINNKILVSKIIDCAKINKDVLIVEIGGGKGIITEELVKHYKKIIVVEADTRLFMNLLDKYKNVQSVEILNDDFLKCQLPEERYSIISNIPFNITADIIRKITSSNSKLEMAYLVMQKEAAYKFVQEKGRETSLLSNILHMNYNIENIFSIKRTNFTPVSKFDALLVLFKKKRKTDFSSEQQIFLGIFCVISTAVLDRLFSEHYLF